ncbi:MAG TPA: EAL domain-containing protein, partial [Acidothermaceae bacterium]|nr:EAL domain-containing protein [Acidothermaceae bacterium]
MPRTRRGVPLFAVYAAASLVPMVALGAVLAITYRADTNNSAMAEARSQASLLANDVVGPQLGATPLHGAIPAAAGPTIAAVFNRASGENRLLRLRIRDMTGEVVWANDVSGLTDSAPDDEASDAVHGEVVSALTRLNSDPGDVGPVGPRVVEIYQPITVGSARTEVGVLEMYLPYAPIQHDVTAGLTRMYGLLGAGLATLWLVLAAISASTTRRLRKRAERLQYIAHHHVASGLLNGEGFADALQRSLESTAGTVNAPALALIDVSRFREINEALGRSHGDQVLLELGRRFAAVAGTGALVARLGGDEFGVASLTDHDTDLHAWALRLQAAVAEPVQADGIPVLIEVAIGYCQCEPGQPVDELLVRADAALGRAKSSVDKCAGYADRPDRAAANVALLPRFRRAISDGELELHYQPKTKLSDGSVVAMEALVRWRLDGELLPPGAFLPSIEQTAMIHPLTDWVARTALAQLASWGDATSELEVAINVSARNLSDPGFASRLLDIVAESGVAAHRLTVEITETALFVDPDAARSCLGALHEAGIALSIDDFGQGQTSLAYLAALPVDELKIDRAFVSRVVADRTHAAIVRSIIQLGHTLGLRVVAEGIERHDEYARVL